MSKIPILAYLLLVFAMGIAVAVIDHRANNKLKSQIVTINHIIKGTPGKHGKKGRAGLQGPKGEKGQKGPKGNTGPRGFPGRKIIITKTRTITVPVVKKETVTVVQTRTVVTNSPPAPKSSCNCKKKPCNPPPCKHE